MAAVYEEITADRLPAQRHGRSYLVRRVDVEDYLTEHGLIAG